MPSTAIVSVTILKIIGLPAASPGAGNTRYARATFTVLGDATFSGRSRPIPDTGGDLQIFPGESSTWGITRGLDDSSSIDMKIEIWEDLGDATAVLDLTITGSLTGPWDAYPTSSSKTLGTGPSFQVFINVKSFNVTDLASLARSIKQKGTSATLAITKGFLLELVSIDGLYKPDPTAVAPSPGSAKVPGYLSRDDQGRIFTNRLPSGDWKSDSQFIDVRLKITAFGGAKFPGGALVHWHADDPDDPTNDSPSFHRDWGPYVDQDDYDGAGNPTGAKATDNALAFSPINVDEDLLFGAGAKGASRWKAGPGGESVSPISRTEATTTLTIVSPTSATTSVQVHCTNVLGTNLVLWADMDGVPVSQVYTDAVTGVMTMWSRLDVEVVRMDGAFSLNGVLPSIPASFQPICVQLDFQPERVVTGAQDLNAVSPDDAHKSSGTSSWIADPLVFSNRNKPGWFFLGGARYSTAPVPPGKGRKPLYSGTQYKLGTVVSPKTGETVGTIVVPADARNASYVQVAWKAGAIDRSAGFGVESATFAHGKTTILLSGNDVTPLFTGWDADGSLDHAYLSEVDFFPLHHRLASAKALAPGGFGVPAKGATVSAFAPGTRRTTLGISPFVQDAASTRYFAGRTVIFTSGYGTGSPLAPVADFNSRVATAVVHEFIHAFGMPHKCGYWNWKTPREKSCCMNYDNTWLIDPKTVAANPTLIPDLNNRMDDNVCGRHLMEVRRVHLELNKGLRW